jgi:hypothetical protein
MAQCVHCGAETELFISEVPICQNCADPPAKKPSPGEVGKTLVRARAAWRYALAVHEEASEIYLSLPSGHPDGTLALHNANLQLDQAAEAFKAALGQFVQAGRKHQT